MSQQTQLAEPTDFNDEQYLYALVSVTNVKFALAE